MSEITFIDRETRARKIEEVYGQGWIDFLYGKNPLAKFLRPLVCKNGLFSSLYGNYMKSPWTRKKIQPFIDQFGIDSSEFLDPTYAFESFNAFFTRHLKPSARPIASGSDVATLPADGRTLVFPDIAHSHGFYVKGQTFNLEQLLLDKKLAHKYSQGSMVISRLAPVDYHRFHFPCNCTPSAPRLINGHLYSVNPLALRRNLDILSENKRVVTELRTPNFGTVLFLEIGATNVGSIHQTFEPEKQYAKGDEKGFFSFGGSCVILLFEPFRIQFDQDLIEASHHGLETLAHMGQSLGRALSPL